MSILYVVVAILPKIQTPRSEQAIAVETQNIASLPIAITVETQNLASPKVTQGYL
jgi:hypothetical protein